MLSCCSLSSSLPWASPAAALAGVCRAPELPPSTANVQECRLQPQTAPAAGPTAIHAASRTQQEGKQLRAQLFPPLWKQKSSDSRSSVPAWGSALQSLSARRGSLSLCVSHGRGGWGRSQNDSHMPRVTGAGEFCRPMPCSNPGSALPPRRCFL